MTRSFLERARKLNRREAKPEITITFEDPLAMVEVLAASANKISSITALAAALKVIPNPYAETF